MAKRYILKEVEGMHGDLHAVIPQLVNVGGQSHAASVLGVTQATIARWLQKNGYVQVVRYERRGA